MFRPQPFQCITRDFASGLHNLVGVGGVGGVHQVAMVALRQVPNPTTDTVRADLVETDYGPLLLDTEGVIDANGVFTLTVAPGPKLTSDPVFENFWYVAFYNATAAGSPLLSACNIAGTSMGAPGGSFEAVFPNGLLTLNAHGP